jgi:predicted PolB exonuclease-like 3'-5' exonuclease
MRGNILYLDIETIPSQSPSIKEEIKDSLKPPANMTKKDTIDKWWEEKAPGIIEEKYLKTALDGSFGEIISIAWAFNDEPVYCVFRKIDDPETNVLKPFFSALFDYLSITWVSFPIRFDCPFIFKRAVINNLMPPIPIPHERSGNAYCPMNAWAGWHEHISLDMLCRVLGIEGKDGMIGQDVWPCVQKGEYEKIVTYNKKDVEMLRQVHKRMMFV